MIQNFYDFQDDGLIFLWVTGRAMELGRECLKLWGYERVDELIWVKTNQLQRIIRTGRNALIYYILTIQGVPCGFLSSTFFTTYVNTQSKTLRKK